MNATVSVMLQHKTCYRHSNLSQRSNDAGFADFLTFYQVVSQEPVAGFFSKILAAAQICSEISDFSTTRVRIVMSSFFFSRRLIDTGQDIIPGCSICADDYSLFCVSAHVLDWMVSGRSVNYLLTEFSRQVETNLRSPRNKLVLPVASPALPGTEIYSPPVPLRSP